MKEIFEDIEFQLGEFGLHSQLSEEKKSVLPKILKEIHKYNVFGSDLLAVPAELIISGDDQEYERPFSFLDLDEGFVNFENEFRSEVPIDFIPMGYLYDASEIVLYNNLNNSIHIFHVSDIVDQDRMKYKLDNPTCTFKDFISQIRLQTVTCLLHPKDYSKATLIELRENKIYLDYEFLASKSEDIWEVYLDKCRSQIADGMEIHYAPQNVIQKLQQ